MDGQTMRMIRGNRTGDEFSKAINEALGKRTDRHKISKWETGTDEIPADVDGLLRLWDLDYKPTGKCTVIAVSLQKGGTLKTTTAVGLSFVLASAGARVLLVDADSQGNATTHVGYNEDVIDDLSNQGRTLYNALSGELPVEDIILETSVEGLDLAPSSIHLALCEIERNDGSDVSKLLLRSLLDKIRDRYDFILIDTSPSLGLLTLNGLVAADKVLVPVQVERFAITGLRHLRNTIGSVQSNLNPELSILGILPTLYSARQVQDRESLADLQSLAGEMVVYEPIPRSSFFARASAALSIPHQVSPGAAGLTSLIQIAENLGVTHGKC